MAYTAEQLQTALERAQAAGDQQAVQHIQAKLEQVATPQPGMNPGAQQQTAQPQAQQTGYTPEQLQTALERAKQAGDQEAVQHIQSKMGGTDQAPARMEQPQANGESAYTPEQLETAMERAMAAGDFEAMERIQALMPQPEPGVIETMGRMGKEAAIGVGQYAVSGAQKASGAMFPEPTAEEGSMLHRWQQFDRFAGAPRRIAFAAGGEKSRNMIQGVGETFMGVMRGGAGGVFDTAAEILDPGKKFSARIQGEDGETVERMDPEALRAAGNEEAAADLEAMNQEFESQSGRLKAAGTAREVSDILNLQSQEDFQQSWERRPDNPVEGYMYDVANAGAYMGAGLLMAAATRNPSAGLWTMFDQVALGKFNEEINAGKNAKDASLEAVLEGAYETIPEKMFGVFQRFIKPGKLARIKQGFAEGGAEFTTEAMHILDEAYRTGELEASPGEIVEQLLYAGAVGMGLGTMIGGGGRPRDDEDRSREKDLLHPEGEDAPERGLDDLAAARGEDVEIPGAETPGEAPQAPEGAEAAPTAPETPEAAPVEPAPAPEPDLAPPEAPEAAPAQPTPLDEARGREPVDASQVTPDTARPEANQSADAEVDSILGETGRIVVGDKPAQFGVAYPANLKVDPEAYQYKQTTDPEGRTDRFTGEEKWDPVAAGEIVVHRRADGDYVADGHQRRALARAARERGQAADELQARAIILNESDGWTAEEVRLLAAMKNIQQETGSATDAAKVLREGGPEMAEELAQFMNPKRASWRDAQGLAQASDLVFNAVLNDKISESHGAVIGANITDEAKQNAALEYFQANPPASLPEAESMARDIERMEATETDQTQGGFDFGDAIAQMPLKERAAILAEARKKARMLKKTFDNLVKNQAMIEGGDAENVLDTEGNVTIAHDANVAADILNRLVDTSPEMNEVLNNAAHELAQGKITKSEAANRLFREAARLARSVPGGGGDEQGGQRPADSPEPEGGAGEAVSQPVRNEAVEGAPAEEVAPDEGQGRTETQATPEPAPETPAEAPEKPRVERRKDTETRKRVSQMSEEERIQALLTDDLTGLGNRRAFNEALEDHDGPVISIDADSLKWINDEMSPDAGDQLLSDIGNAIRNNTEEGQGFHISGDEFYILPGDGADATQIMADIQAELDQVVLEQTKPDGEVIVKTGLEVTYGEGTSKQEADNALKQAKRSRQEAGERAPRGEEPRGVSRQPAGISPEPETGRQADRQEAEPEAEVEAPAGRQPRSADSLVFKIRRLKEILEYEEGSPERYAPVDEQGEPLTKYPLERDDDLLEPNPFAVIDLETGRIERPGRYGLVKRGSDIDDGFFEEFELPSYVFEFYRHEVDPRVVFDLVDIESGETVLTHEQLLDETAVTFSNQPTDWNRVNQIFQDIENKQRRAKFSVIQGGLSQGRDSEASKPPVEGEVLSETEEMMQSFVESEQFDGFRAISAIQHGEAPSREIPITDEKIDGLTVQLGKSKAVESLQEAVDAWNEFKLRMNQRYRPDGTTLSLNGTNVAWITEDGKVRVPDQDAAAPQQQLESTPQPREEQQDAEQTRSERTRKPGRKQADSGTTGGVGRAGGQQGGTRPPLRVASKSRLPRPRVHVDAESYQGGLDEAQQLGVNLALDRFESGGKGFMLGDGTGVGKTRQILAIADQVAQNTGGKVLIVTQNKQIINNNFRDDAQAMGVNLDSLEMGTYDSVRTGENGKGEYELVIFDEAHNLKNTDSQKTIAADNIQTKHKVFATATAMDRPSGGVYFLSQITGRDPADVYAQIGLNVTEGLDDNGNMVKKVTLKEGFGWNDIKRNLIALRDEAISQGAMVRREYPFYGEITTAEATLPRDLADEQAKLDEYWQDQIEAANSYAQRRNRAGQRIGELSRWLEAQKVDEVYRHVKAELAEGRQVIVIAEGVNRTKIKGLGKEFPGLIGELAARLENEGIGFAKIYGSGNKADAVSKFQSGQVRVALATPKSGGAGINLDDSVGGRPRTMVVATANYAGDVFDQILGRVSRRNTASPAKVVNVNFVNGESDIRRAEILQRKLEALRAIQAGDDLDLASMQPDDDINKPRFSLKQPSDTDVFYSAVQQAVEQIKQDKAQPKQWLAMIRKQPGVKKEELDWIGLEQWLNDQGGAVEKSEILEFIAQNEVQIEEVLFYEPVEQMSDEIIEDIASDELRILAEGGITVGWMGDHFSFFDANDEVISYSEIVDKYSEEVVEAATEIEALTPDWDGHSPIEGEAQYGEYQVGGGQNYRELVLKMELPRPTPLDMARKLFGEHVETIHNLSEEQLERLAGAIRRSSGDTFQSPHFDEPNVIVHVRFNERTDADGNLVLFIEEVQSDWHQKGKQEGYDMPSNRERLHNLTKRLGDALREDDYLGFDTVGEALEAIRLNDDAESRWEMSEETKELAKEYRRLSRNHYIFNSVPDAPFKKSWPMLAMKRMIRYAADNGYDRITWTPGEVQADRYDLSKKVTEIVVRKEHETGNRNIWIGTANSILDLWVGPDGKILSATLDEMENKSLDEVIGKELAEKVMGIEDKGKLEGPDLRVGGEGMRSFYDKILRNEVNKYVKKMGAKVGTTWVDTMETGGKGQLKAWAVDVTPKMREAAQAGQPLFKRGDQATEGQGVDALQWVKELTAGWALARGRVKVARDESELPPVIRKEIIAQGARGKIAGVYHNGQAWIIANNATERAEVERVLLHELKGHYGLRKLMGDDLKPLLNKVWYNYGRKGLQEFIDAYFPADGPVKFDVNNPNHRMKVAEEKLASLAETNPQNRWVQQAIGAIRDWLRKIGFTLQLTDADLIRLMSKAGEVVERGVDPVLAKGLPYWASADFITPDRPTWGEMGERISEFTADQLRRFMQTMAPGEGWSRSNRKTLEDEFRKRFLSFTGTKNARVPIEAWEAATEPDIRLSKIAEDQRELLDNAPSENQQRLERRRREIEAKLRGKEYVPPEDGEGDLLAPDQGEQDTLFARKPEEDAGPKRNLLSWAIFRVLRGIAWGPSKAWNSIDHILSSPLRLMGDLDAANRSKWAMASWDKLTETLREWKPQSERAPVRWIGKFLDITRAGVWDRWGQDPDYIDRSRGKERDKDKILLVLGQILDRLEHEGLSRKELVALQEILEGKEVNDDRLNKLAPSIRRTIDDLGYELVRLGQLDEATWRKGLGKYLHRSYAKFEQEFQDMPFLGQNIVGRRRRGIIGDELRARGLKQHVTQADLERATPKEWWQRKKIKGKADPALKETRWVVLEKVVDVDAEMNQIEEAGEGKPQRKVLDRVYLPADESIPNAYAGWENRGEFEVLGIKGNKITLRRDYTDAEMRAMGKIMDARFNLIRTFQLFAHDIANGRFFQDIAKNGEWSTKKVAHGDRVAYPAMGKMDRLRTYTGYDWVKVPNTEIGDTGKKVWGALAGRYVKPEIWRDLNEIHRAAKPGPWKSVLTHWKLNKTARNPVVHMNNVMSNLVLMDLADVSLMDLMTALEEFTIGGTMFLEAQEGGAFGGMFTEQELNRRALRPVIDKIKKDMKKHGDTPQGRAKALSDMLGHIFNVVKKADNLMVNAYQVEDVVFRLATFIRYRNAGFSVNESATIAVDQFLNYDIRAPWVNAARASVLPFISYTYRAAPMVAQSIAYRPWKFAKFVLLGYIWNQLAYLWDDEGEEELERGTLRKQVTGMTWASIPGTDIGLHRFIKMPWRDEHGQAQFLDIMRWMPAGDVFDTNQTMLGYPAWLQVGGPIPSAFEILLNRSAFTGEEIVDPAIEDLHGTWSAPAMRARMDYAWKAYSPGAAIIPGTWHWDKIASAIRGREDQLGRKYSTKNAALSGVGIKINPHDPETALQRRGWELDRTYQALQQQMRKAERDLERNRITKKDYDRMVRENEKAQEKLLEKVEEMSKLAEKL